MRKPRIDKSTKAAKYFIARKIKGLPRAQAAQEAGLTDIRNTGHTMQTKVYQELERRYKDFVLDEIGMDEVAKEHVKNIRQDEDKGAKNKAIQMFIERLEEKQEEKDDDKLLVVLKG